MITGLMLRLAALRWFLKLGGLGLLLPVAFLLKVIGVPILAVLSVLALPLLILLFVIGLPVFLVLIVGSMLMGLLGMALTIGVAALKFGLFVVLPILLLVKILSWLFRRGGGGDSTMSKPKAKPSPDATDSASASAMPDDMTMDPSTESRANPTGDPMSGPISDL